MCVVCLLKLQIFKLVTPSQFATSSSNWLGYLSKRVLPHFLFHKYKVYKNNKSQNRRNFFN